MYKFYTEDCLSVGVPPSRSWGTDRIPMNPDNIPNFNGDAQSRGSMRDELLQDLNIRVANIVNYNENEDTLLEHINQGSSDLITEF